MPRAKTKPNKRPASQISTPSLWLVGMNYYLKHGPGDPLEVTTVVTAIDIVPTETKTCQGSTVRVEQGPRTRVSLPDIEIRGKVPWQGTKAFQNKLMKHIRALPPQSKRNLTYKGEPIQWESVTW